MSEVYSYELPSLKVSLEASRLWWDRHELHGQLALICLEPSDNMESNILHIGTFNFSSVRSQAERAKLLMQRAGQIASGDWNHTLEKFSHKVIAAEQQGQPGQDLRTFKSEISEDIVINGLSFPKEHPSILFGDGGSAKSYTALYLAGQLANRGMRIAYFDWELSGNDHRRRLELMFGDKMPMINYVRCDLPLMTEVERLQREVRHKQIDYAIYDSIVFACEGPPETAEIAGKYFRAVRQIGCGSLHLAHTNKSENSDQKPFGSAFWHNGARSTWFVKAVNEDREDGELELGFWNRKSNLGPRHKPVGLRFQFLENHTKIVRDNISDSVEMTNHMTVSDRMVQALRRGAMSKSELADRLDVSENTIYQTFKRKENKLFVLLDGGKIGNFATA